MTPVTGCRPYPVGYSPHRCNDGNPKGDGIKMNTNFGRVGACVLTVASLLTSVTAFAASPQTSNLPKPSLPLPKPPVVVAPAAKLPPQPHATVTAPAFRATGIPTNTRAAPVQAKSTSLKVLTRSANVVGLKTVIQKKASAGSIKIITDRVKPISVNPTGNLTKDEAGVTKADTDILNAAKLVGKGTSGTAGQNAGALKQDYETQVKLDKAVEADEKGLTKSSSGAVRADVQKTGKDLTSKEKAEANLLKAANKLMMDKQSKSSTQRREIQQDERKLHAAEAAAASADAKVKNDDATLTRDLKAATATASTPIVNPAPAPVVDPAPAPGPVPGPAPVPVAPAPTPVTTSGGTSDPNAPSAPTLGDPSNVPVSGSGYFARRPGAPLR